MPAVEDRKRPALATADDLPPSKRQAVNGNKMNAKESPVVDMREETWIDKFTKGAIYREMQEYSRRATTVESRLEVLHERSMHHDDHVRLIDAWWRQMLEEIELITNSAIPGVPDHADPPFLSRVQFADLGDFQEHLAGKGQAIREKAEALITRLADSRGGEVGREVVEWESKVARLLVVQKNLMVKLDGLSAEKDQLSEQLNTATLRYFKAEKKLDRARSTQVQQLEQQALASSTKSPKTADAAKDASEVNGSSNETLIKYQEAAAVAAKHREQLEVALADIKTLADENSTLKSRREPHVEDDSSRSEVVKALRGQCEELIKRINHLEATNRQLREDWENFAAERTEFKTQLEHDATAITQDLETDITTKDQDLARIRAMRDEYHVELLQRKASQDQQKHAHDEMKSYVEQREHRIEALETELQRLKPAEEDVVMVGSGGNVDELRNDDVGTKYRELERKYALMNSEISSMEQAYRKTNAIAKKKVLDLEEHEQKMGILIAEKSKADKRYYETQTNNLAKKSEIAALRVQNGRSSEIISQLKEVEVHNRTLLANFEKQVMELKKTNSVVVTEHKKMELASAESARKAESLRLEITELTNLVKSRDATAAAIRERNMTLETEFERLKVRIEHAHKDRDSWKSKALSNSSEEEGLLRTFALCSICRNNFKNTTLKTCGHLFCKDCVDSRLSNRMRKCPTCSRAFDRTDVMAVHH